MATGWPKMPKIYLLGTFFCTAHTKFQIGTKDQSISSTYKVHQVLGQRSFWANKNRALIEGALFEIGQKRALI